MRREDETIQPIAALMTLVVPGSGYLWFRETSRAVYAFIGIAGLLLGGLLIGGIDVVDSRESKYWFYVQALNPAAAFSINYAHQNFYKGYEVRGGQTSENFYRKPEYGERLKFDESRGVTIIVNDASAGTPSPRQSIGRVNEVGSLFVALAGMLNLIVLLDVGWHAPRPPAASSSKGGSR
jgi:hypothetical protein